MGSGTTSPGATATQAKRDRPLGLGGSRLKPTDDGPLMVEGPITVVDGEGRPLKEFAEGDKAYLCRCGGSQNKPFCDGTHTKVGFESKVRAE